MNSYVPFKLYSLQGCPACAQATNFFVQNKLPCELVYADNDPIIDAGVVAINGKSEYPLLLSRLTNEIIVGFKQEDYERINKIWGVLVKTGELKPIEKSVIISPDGEVV